MASLDGLSKDASNVRALYLGTDNRCQELLDEAAVKAALESKAGVLWVDLPSLDEGRESLLRDVFRFHPLAIEDCANGRIDTPKIDDYGDYLFIVAQSVGYGGKTEILQLTEVDLFLGPNYVVSVRTHSIEPIDDLFRNAVTNSHMLRRGADFLAHMIIDQLVDLILPAVEAMDEDLADVESRILESADKLLLRRVLLLKRNALRLRRSIVPQRDMVNRLSRAEFALISSDAALHF